MNPVLISGYVYIGLLLCVGLLSLMMIILTKLFFDIRNKHIEIMTGILMLDRNGKERANLLKVIESFTFSSTKQLQEMGAFLSEINRNVLSGNKQDKVNYKELNQEAGDIKRRQTWSKKREKKALKK